MRVCMRPSPFCKCKLVIHKSVIHYHTRNFYGTQAFPGEDEIFLEKIMYGVEGIPGGKPSKTQNYKKEADQKERDVLWANMKMRRWMP